MMEAERMIEQHDTAYWSAKYWLANRALQARNYSQRRQDAFDTMVVLVREAIGTIQALARAAVLRFLSRWNRDATLSDMTGTYRLSGNGRRAEWFGQPDPWVVDTGDVML